MTPRQVRKHYETPSKFAAATGYTRMVIYNWERLKRVPPRAQMHLELLTGGELIADKRK